MTSLSLSEQLTLWVYGVVMRLARPLLRRKLLRRARAEPGYAHDIEARFGHYRDVTGRAQAGVDFAAPVIWIHAVSLGEARAAAILVEPLRRLIPGMRLLLTHSTATGWSEGASMLQPGDSQTWLPWDDPGSVQRFLARFRPTVGVLVETEVWPHLVRACEQGNVPLALANARMNERSMAKALQLRWLSRPAFAGLQAVWAQTPDDARRLTELGAHVNAVTGNLKFDARPDQQQRELAARWRGVCQRPVVLLASSREGEEVAFLKEIERLSLSNDGFIAINSDESELADQPIWLVVPRHPQRFDQVAHLLTQAGFRVRRRAEWGADLDDRVAAMRVEPLDGSMVLASAESPAEPMDRGTHVLNACAQNVAKEVWLGDSMGEMTLYYSFAHVALLGGSFEPLGGQNLIEAAACGCPVYLGPHTFNFAEAADAAVKAGAAVRVDNMAEAVSGALQLLGQREAHDQAVLAAQAFASSRQGAAGVMARAIRQLVTPSGDAEPPVST